MRILGIDTPEKYGRRECGAVTATESMDPARTGRVDRAAVVGPEPGRQGPLRARLRYVERKGLDVGRAQIFTGIAKAYVYRNDPFRRTATTSARRRSRTTRSAVVGPLLVKVRRP